MFDEYYRVSDVASKLGKSETQIWNDINEGRLAAVVPADITSSNGEIKRFDYSLAPREVILRMRAGTHELIEWENFGITRVARSNPDMILVATRDRNANSFEEAVYWETSEPTTNNAEEQSSSPSKAITTNRLRGEERSDALKSVIDEATRLALNKNDVSSIWSALVKMAEGKDRPAPLWGYIPEGVQYLGTKYATSGEPDVFTKKNLMDRIARKKKKAKELANTR